MLTRFWKYTLFVGLFIVLASIGAGIWFTTYTTPLSQYASSIITSCKEYESSLRRICYEKHVPSLGLTMEDAFLVVDLIQAQDPEYRWTHNMGHLLSEQEYYRDPYSWQDILRRCPTGQFSDGCPHGVMQAHFRTDTLTEEQFNELLPQLTSLCEDRPTWTPLQRASCYHGIGHSTLFLANADIDRALSMCSVISSKPDADFRSTCFEGIFMQIFEPRQPEDFALIYDLVPDQSVRTTCEHHTNPEAKGACWEGGWKNMLSPFCTQFTGLARQSCFGEGWIIADKAQLETAPGMTAYCTEHFFDTEQEYCYNKLIYSLMARLEFDDQRVRNVCAQFSDMSNRGACFAHTASRLIETDSRFVDRAVVVCEDATAHAVGLRCYEELSRYLTFAIAADTPQFVRLCNALPEELQNGCKS